MRQCYRWCSVSLAIGEFHTQMKRGKNCFGRRLLLCGNLAAALILSELHVK